LRLYAAWCWNLTQPDGPERLQGDEPGYDRLARALLAGRGIDWPGRVPLYPLWLAAVYALTGGSYRAVPIAQAFLGATAIPLAYLLGRRVFGHAVGLLTALGVTLSCQLVLEVRPLMSEVLFTPVVLLAMLLLWNATQDPSTTTWSATAGTPTCRCGPTCSTRPARRCPTPRRWRASGTGTHAPCGRSPPSRSCTFATPPRSSRPSGSEIRRRTGAGRTRSTSTCSCSPSAFAGQCC